MKQDASPAKTGESTSAAAAAAIAAIVSAAAAAAAVPLAAPATAKWTTPAEAIPTAPAGRRLNLRRLASPVLPVITAVATRPPSPLSCYPRADLLSRNAVV
jgi:hypothetical protein